MMSILEVQVDYNLKSLSEKTIVLERVYFINNSKGTILSMVDFHGSSLVCLGSRTKKSGESCL